MNKSGLYSLVLASRKPQARAFRRWMTGEVLLAIRKTGQYMSPGLDSPDTPRDPKIARILLPDNGRYVITHAPAGALLCASDGCKGHVRRNQGTDCKILSHALLLIHGCRDRFQHLRATSIDLENGFSFSQLKAIREGAYLGKHYLEFYDKKR